MVNSPRVISRATKSSTASSFGNELASAVNFTEDSLAFCGGQRSATVLSAPISPGHGRAADVATASSFRNHNATEPRTPITANTMIAAFFSIRSD